MFSELQGENLGYMNKYMLLQTGKVRNYQNTDQGNQVQLTYVRDYTFFRAPFAPKNNNYVQTNYA